MSFDYNLLKHYDRKVPTDKIGRRRTMAYYDDSYRAKMQREQKTKYYTPLSKMNEWKVTSVDVQFDDEAMVLIFPTAVQKEQLLTTLQFLCTHAPTIGSAGLPSLLELTSSERLQEGVDGRQCLHLSRREYAIITAALLPLYLEPSSKNISRENGYKPTAFHPILMRYAMTRSRDDVVDGWRQWAFIRALAALTNSTVSGAPLLDYAGGVTPIENRHFVVYTLILRILDIMFEHYGRSTARFVHALKTTTIIYDAMAAFLMPQRLDYINYRLIDEVMNIAEHNIEFATRNITLIAELRKLSGWVSTLDEHSRVRIKVERDDTRCDVNFDMLHTGVYFAACEPIVDKYVAMAMLCSLSVSKRSNKSLYRFLDNLPTPCQFSRRTQDLFNRATQGWPACDHDNVVKEVLREVVTTSRYDSVLGMTGAPVKLKRPHFPLKRMRDEYVTRSYEQYLRLVRDEAETIMDDRVVVKTPLEPLYLYLSSFDRHLSTPTVEELDAWDLLTNRLLCSDHLLPLTPNGHYLDRSFFHL